MESWNVKVYWFSSMSILHFFQGIWLLANTNSMEKLPMEILENILDRLPIETALQAKRVCKTWRFLLRCKTYKVGLLFTFYRYNDKNKLRYGDEYDPIRGKMNYSYSYDRLDKCIQDYIYINTLLGSCNGLVCFRPFIGRTHFLICNPFTGEVVYVPKHNSMEQKLSWLSGFGYCHSTNEYKIVIIHRQDTSNTVKVKVLVFTIGGGGWRSKGSMDPIFTLNSSGIYANGALHWLDRHDRIVAFDLKDENFHYIPLPLHKHDRFNRPLKLLGGNNLCLVHTTYEPYCMDIWTYKRKTSNASANGCDMKQNYNDKNSWDWIKEFSIEWKDMGRVDMFLLNPLAITSNDQVLFCYKYNNTIYCYDRKTSTKKRLFNGHDCDNMIHIDVVSHANSLVSISSKDLQKVQPFDKVIDILVITAIAFLVYLFI